MGRKRIGVKRLSISIPEKLYKELNDLPIKFNVSKVCSAAIREAVKRRKKILDDPALKRFTEKLASLDESERDILTKII